MPLAMREEQADADQEQEARRDAARKQLPAAMRRHAGLEIAEEFEIPGEMIDRHGDQRGAARQVDRLDARQFGRDRGEGDAGSTMAPCCSASPSASARRGAPGEPLGPVRVQTLASFAIRRRRVGFLLSARPARRQPCGDSRPTGRNGSRRSVIRSGFLRCARRARAPSPASTALESFARASVSSVVPIQAYDLLQDEQAVSILYTLVVADRPVGDAVHADADRPLRAALGLHGGRGVADRRRDLLFDAFAAGPGGRHAGAQLRRRRAVDHAQPLHHGPHPQDRVRHVRSRCAWHGRCFGWTAGPTVGVLLYAHFGLAAAHGVSALFSR